MKIRKLNERIQKFLNEERKPDFESVLISAMERIKAGKPDKLDAQIVKDFNSVLSNNIELSAKIYEIILNNQSSLANELIDSIRGSKTYSNLIETKPSKEQFYKDIQDLFGLDLNERKKWHLDYGYGTEIIIAELDLGKSSDELVLKIYPEDELELVLEDGYDNPVYYNGSSLKDCLTAIKRFLSSKSNVLSVNQNIAPLVKLKKRFYLIDNDGDSVD
jgi:hypothetical protein